MQIFKGWAYSSVMCIVLDNVNVKGGNVIKPSDDKSVPVKSWQSLADKRGMSPKTIDM